MSKKGHLQQEKEVDLQETHHGSVGQDSPIEHLGEETEMTEMEEMEETEEAEAEEVCHLPPEEIQKSETMGRS